MELETILKLNENENVTHHNLWDAAKQYREFGDVNATIQPEKMAKINDIVFHVEKLDTEEQI